MRTIDGVRYMSAKEYAEMMNLTVSRVSQIKSELPFVRFEEFGIEVINFDLLDLQLKERAFAQAQFQTANPLHSYSYKDLGNFFAKFALDLVQFKGNADVRIEELQNKNQELTVAKSIDDKQLNELVLLSENFKTTIKNTTEDLLQEKNLAGQLKEELNTKNVAYQELLLKFDTLHSSHQEAVRKAEFKSLEFDALTKEYQAQLKRIKDLENQNALRGEFEDFKQIVLKKIEGKPTSKK